MGKVVEPSVVNINVKTSIKGALQKKLPIPEDQLRKLFPDRDGDGQPDLPEGFDEEGGMEAMRHI